MGGSRVSSGFVVQKYAQFLGSTSRQGRLGRSPRTATGRDIHRRMLEYETQLYRRRYDLACARGFWGSVNVPEESTDDELQHIQIFYVDPTDKLGWQIVSREYSGAQDS